MHSPTSAPPAPCPPVTDEHGLVRPPDVGDVAFQVLVHDGYLCRVWRDAAVRRGTLLTPALRAAALAGVVPARGVICRRSAAWIHLGGVAPSRVELLIAPGARRPGPHPDRVVVAASVAKDDVQTLGGLAVTTVQRTGLDLARCCSTEAALPLLRALAPIGFDAAAAWQSLARLAGHRGVLLAEGTLRTLLRGDARPAAAA